MGSNPIVVIHEIKIYISCNRYFYKNCMKSVHKFSGLVKETISNESKKILKRKWYVKNEEEEKKEKKKKKKKKKREINPTPNYL